MFFEIKQEHLEIVMNEIYNSNLYENPRIDFVLVKKINGKNYYSVGVSNKLDPTKAYLFRPKAKAKSIPIQNVRYDKQKYRDLFDECIEGYVLQQIQKGYDIVFMSIAFHISMWEFVNLYYENIEYFDEGLTNYFRFCYETGISSTLLSNYTYIPFPDFIYYFLDEITYEFAHDLVEKLIEDNMIIIKSLGINNEIYKKILGKGNKNEERS